MDTQSNIRGEPYWALSDNIAWDIDLTPYRYLKYIIRIFFMSLTVPCPSLCLCSCPYPCPCPCAYSMDMNMDMNVGMDVNVDVDTTTDTYADIYTDMKIFQRKQRNLVFIGYGIVLMLG